MIEGNIRDAYNKELYTDFSEKLKSVYPAFDSKSFIMEVFCPEWEEMELYRRIRHSAAVLDKFLPVDYTTAVGIIEKVLPLLTNAQWPAASIFPEYIAIRGLDDLDISEKVMHIVTRYASCEFAVRPFIEKYGHEMIDRMIVWTDSECEHVRRLASEGTRISVPCGIKLRFVEDNPDAVLPLLNKLMDDPSEYVRRSVANNLNEMSKSAKMLMLDFCGKWLGKSIETDKLIKHAVRTLLKNGDAEAMAMFGMTKPAQISIINFECDDSANIGGSLCFSFVIVNDSGNPQKLRIGYDLGLPGASGKMNIGKVRISERLCPPGKTIIQRKHPMQNTSTRTLRPGAGIVKITINGENMAEARFILK